MCVFQLRTVTGNEFLLQSETDSLIREWYKTIQNVIDRLVSQSTYIVVLTTVYSLYHFSIRAIMFFFIFA